MANSISICSANCQGLGSGFSGKRRDVMNYMRNKKCDIYFLQDTHFHPNVENIIKAEWGYECWFNSYTSRARGVAILFNNTFEYKIKKIINDESGNYLIMHLAINGVEYILVNLYAPNRDDPLFFTNIQTLLLDLGVDNIIMGGDWNLLLNPKQDGNNYKNINNSKAKEVVENISFQLNIADIWREQHPETKQFTWHKKINNRIVQQGRLDFFLISSSLTRNITKSSIHPGYRSDHSCIIIEMNKTHKRRSKTFWKLNNELLKDQQYIENVHTTIDKIKQEYMPKVYNLQNIREINDLQPNINDQLFLEVLLMEIRAMTLGYSALKKKHENNEEKTLIKDIQELEKNKKENEEYITAKVERLETLRKKKLSGSLIRARSNWIENGEKPTKYFCNLENRHFTNKHITKLIDKHGNEMFKDEDIVNETKNFYENLYLSRDDSLCNVDTEKFKNVIDNKLTDDEALQLEGEITLQELAECLRKMKNNKSPGSDGFSVEFFKFFWRDMKYFLLNAVNESFQKGELPITQREGLITCIPKGNKPREYLKNWRPICLLNVIYKLCSGCIASRIKGVLPKLIKEDQTGFIKNRFIGDNLRLTYDIMHHVNTNKKRGMLLLIDFEKAFDTISWKFILDTLNIFNFKDEIKRWIKIFLNNIKSCVVVNNKVSHWFKIYRGCRQGDPISPYLFILCAEILAVMIRNNKNIKGIYVGSKEYKISLYADDTTLFLDGSKDSFEYCVQTILEYAKFSGLNMNFDKTNVICLGQLRNSDLHYMPDLNLHWNPQSFTLLGLEFNADLKNLMDINLKNKMKQMKNIMNSWAKRNLTPLGRITVLKTLVVSKITHILLVLPPAQSKLIEEIEKLFFKFVWKGKPDKLKRVYAYNSIKEGGMNMLNFKSFHQALILTWLRRLLNDDNASWKSIILNDCKPLKYLQAFGPSYGRICEESTTNQFWIYVLKYYKIYSENFLSQDTFHSEPLFYNNKANISNNLRGCQKLIDCGILFVHQLYNIEEKRMLSRNEIFDKYQCNIDFITMKHIEKGIQKLRKTYNNVTGNNPREQNQPFSCYIQSIMKDEKGTKTIYNHLLQKKKPLNIQTKWQNEGYTDIDWSQVYTKIERSLKCTRLRWFQIRIANRILTTNKSVSKFITEQSPLCSFCNLEDETIEHLFYDCSIIKLFWGKLSQAFNKKCPRLLLGNIPKSFILLGYSPNFVSTQIFDMIIVMAKLYIYRQKVRGEGLILAQFIQEIENVHAAEKYNAVIKNKESAFTDRWINIRTIFAAE